MPELLGEARFESAGLQPTSVRAKGDSLMRTLFKRALYSSY